MKKLTHYVRNPVDDMVIEMLEHSNWIENETSQEALDDAVKAWTYAVKNYKNITTNYILKIHKLMQKRLRPDIAGQVRHCDVWIGGRLKPYISDALIMDDLKAWLGIMWDQIDKSKGEPETKKKKKAEALHIYFEAIHPFEDGNGRVGRILYNINRLQMGLPIHIIRHGEEQKAYYEWFK